MLTLLFFASIFFYFLDFFAPREASSDHPPFRNSKNVLAVIIKSHDPQAGALIGRSFGKKKTNGYKAMRFCSGDPWQAP